MAQYDTSIYQNLLSGVRSPESFAAERQQVEASALTNALNRQKVDEYQAGIKRQGELRNLLSGGANADALRRGGFLEEAAGMEKNAAEVGLKNAQATKYGADAQQAQLKAAGEKLSMIYNAASGARDQQSYTMALQGLQAAGIDVSGIPAQFDPAYVENAKTQALTQMQRLDQAMKQQQFGETVRDNRARVEATIRGQDLSAATARRGQDISASTAIRGQDLVEGREKSKAAGSGNITEGERNASGYASRMVEATKLLDTFEKTGKQTYGDQIIGAIPLVGSALQREGMSADQQRYRQAAEDWVRAKLRKESGAVIGKEEMEAEIATYFPKPGDKPENIAQKRRAREVATQAMIKSGGRGMQDSDGASGSWGDGWTIQEVK